MINLSEYWTFESDFFIIKNPENAITIPYNKDLYHNFILLSEYYFDSADKVVEEILENNDNIKSDGWFLSAMYLFRQAIELLCKALIIDKYERKDLTSIFANFKHNISSIFELYLKDTDNIGKIYSPDELVWLSKYLQEMEVIDKNSDLFRYPFNDDFLLEHKNKILDIVDTANSFLQCYSLIFKSVKEKYNPNKYIENIQITTNTDFLSFTTQGLGNCMLDGWFSGNGFYKIIHGYSEVAEYLYDLFISEQKVDYLLPCWFSLRNAIELSLKNILTSDAEMHVDKKIQKSKKKSHLLYKDLWRSIKGVVTHYASKNGEDLTQLDILEDALKKISAVDKKGDKFRYPINYGLEVYFYNDKMDPQNIFSWLAGVFNILDGIGGIIEQIKDYEVEMYSEYGG